MNENSSPNHNNKQGNLGIIAAVALVTFLVTSYCNRQKLPEVPKGAVEVNGQVVEVQVAPKSLTPAVGNSSTSVEEEVKNEQDKVLRLKLEPTFDVK